MAKEWSAKEISYLKRYAATKEVQELVQRVDAEEGEVRAKLDELGLVPKGGARRSLLGDEPLLATYEQALKALYGGKRDKAEKLLTRVMEECDQPELAERARQLLAATRQEDGDGAPQTDDDFMAAVFEKNRGNYARALEIAKRGGRSSKDERFAYLEASIHALEHRLDEAAAALQRAIELNGKNRVHAFHDPDFAPLRKSREHAGTFA